LTEKTGLDIDLDEFPCCAKFAIFAFFTIRHTKIFDLKENIAMKFPSQMFNPQAVVEKEFSDSEDGEKYWH